MKSKGEADKPNLNLGNWRGRKKMKWPLRILNFLFWLVVLSVCKVLLDRAGVGGAIPIIILMLIILWVLKMVDKKIVGRFDLTSAE